MAKGYGHGAPHVKGSESPSMAHDFAHKDPQSQFGGGKVGAPKEQLNKQEGLRGGAKGSSRQD